MKNYLSFTLTGKRFFPTWIAYMVLFILPYAAAIYMLINTPQGTAPSVFVFPLFALSMLVVFIFIFYVNKISIESLVYREEALVFNGTFGKFAWLIVLGSFLSIITLGIYLAWFIRDLQRFFVNNSVYKTGNFDFRGKGGQLFLILTLTLLIPMIVLMGIMVGYTINYKESADSIGFIYPVAMIIMMIPYMYYVYKWSVNINYKERNISWETNFWNSCGKIALELFLTVITLGIYFPMAQVRLYKYFVDKTVLGSDENKSRFGYDIDPFDDFLYIWGQTLLAIITLGIYYPWTFCKIRSRILGKTYLTKI